MAANPQIGRNDPLTKGHGIAVGQGERAGATRPVRMQAIASQRRGTEGVRSSVFCALLLGLKDPENAVPGRPPAAQDEAAADAWREQEA